MVAREALAVAQLAIPAHSSKYCPKKFDEHQLFVCLVLKGFHKADYRGIASILEDNPTLCQEIRLKKVPHFTTIQKASTRLLKHGPFQDLLRATLRDLSAPVILAAVDSTGLETGHTSPYFVRRRAKCQRGYQTLTYTRFPKLGIVVDCFTHLILAAETGTGPSPDVTSFQRLLFQTLGNVPVGTILADAGYDSEPNHVFARDRCRVRSVIPPLVGRRKIRTTQVPPATLQSVRVPTRWRDRMRLHFDSRYGQRWQVEAANSMIKRLQGCSVAGRSEPARNRDMMLMTLTHNILICAQGLPPCRKAALAA